MFFGSLKRFGPESTLLLAAALFGGCVETTDAGNDGITIPDGGLPSEGTPGGSSPGGSTPGGSTPGGSTPGGSTPGGSTPGGSTPGGTTAGGATPGGTAAGATTAGSTSGTTAGGSTPGGTTAGGTTAGGTTAGTSDGGTPGGTVNFAGRAMGCSSYGLPMAPAKCSGYYCKISQDELTTALPTSGKCGMFTAARVCDGALTRSVGSCARMIKSANPFDNDATIRMKTQACVKMDTQYSDVTDACLGCFLDAAQCASKSCLVQCLSGDSAACDTCRMTNNCNQPVPACAGLPNPF